MKLAFGLAFLASALALALAQDPQRERLKQALKDTDLAGAWIYDDVHGGLALARKTGKPALFIFR